MENLINIRLIIDIILIILFISIVYWNYRQLLKKENFKIKNNIDAKFSIASEDACEIKSLSFFIVIDSIKSDQVGIYLDVEILGDYKTLILGLPIIIKNNTNDDRENEIILGKENESILRIINKEKTSTITKINTYVYGNIATSREISSCKFIFSLYDFYVNKSPYENGGFLKGVSSEIYTPNIKNMSVIFKCLDKIYKPDPKNSLPSPTVFLSEELRWYSGSKKNDHSSIYAIFTNYSKLEENKRKYFFHSIIFALSSSALVAIILDFIWNFLKAVE